MRSTENNPRSGRKEEDNLYKGEQQPTTHKGAPSVSKKGKEPHRKDESDRPSDKGNEKKGSNAV